MSSGTRQVKLTQDQIQDFNNQLQPLESPADNTQIADILEEIQSRVLTQYGTMLGIVISKIRSEPIEDAKNMALSIVNLFSKPLTESTTEGGRSRRAKKSRGGSRHKKSIKRNTRRKL
jgi:hypothetical protein